MLLWVSQLGQRRLRIHVEVCLSIQSTHFLFVCFLETGFYLVLQVGVERSKWPKLSGKPPTSALQVQELQMWAHKTWVQGGTYS